jgi:hypothetical protein
MIAPFVFLLAAATSDAPDLAEWSARLEPPAVVDQEPEMYRKCRVYYCGLYWHLQKLDDALKDPDGEADEK